MAKIDLKRARVDEKFEGDLDIDELMFQTLFTFAGNEEYDIYSKIENEDAEGETRYESE